MLPEQYQNIICTNAGILLIWTLGTNLSEILIKIHDKCISKYRLWNRGHFCLNLSVLIGVSIMLIQEKYS